MIKHNTIIGREYNTSQKWNDITIETIRHDYFFVEAKSLLDDY